jgi:hypothetical protein
MQLHGYLHNANQEEFGFNADEHYHIHQQTQAPTESEYTHESL